MQRTAGEGDDVSGSERASAKSPIVAPRRAAAEEAPPEQGAAPGQDALAQLSPGGKLHAPPPPEHPTARSLRRAQLRERQRSGGNQAAQRLIQRDETSLPSVPDYQLTPPSLFPAPRRPSLLGEGPYLHLDPQIEAELRAQQIRTALSPAQLRPLLARLPLEPILLAPGGGLPAAPPPAPQPGPPAQPQPRVGERGEPPRAGSGGDILRAIAERPEVEAAIGRLGDHALMQWQRLRLGGQVAVVSTSALIAGGALAGIATSPEARRFVFEQLSGAALPVPGADWLHVELNVADDNLMFGLHLDVGRFLPAALGFGPGSPEAIGEPPQLEGAPGSPPLRRSLAAHPGRHRARRYERGRPSAQAVARSPAFVQRSPLSDELRRLWDAAVKGRFFDRLRAVSPSADRDARAFIEGSLSGDDCWLARTILLNGPEPLWPREALDERGRRAAANGWAAEPGHIEGMLGQAGHQVRALYFPGLTDRRALVIGGVHGSELAGIEVAESLAASLRTGPRPYFTVIIVPELFAANAARARAQRPAPGTNSNIGRYTPLSDVPAGNRVGQGSGARAVDPNRQFPDLGTGMVPTAPTDAEGRPIEPENVALLQLIERFHPERIASVHSIRSATGAGVFADPRTDAAGNLQQAETDADRDLALTMAAHAQAGGANVPGNKLNTDGTRGPRSTAIYGLAPGSHRTGARPQKPSSAEGVSLGDWGSTEVRHNGPGGAADPRDRPSMSVITIEVQHYESSDMYRAGSRAQAQRIKELQAHRDAIREIFLGPPNAVRRP